MAVFLVAALTLLTWARNNECGVPLRKSCDMKHYYTPHVHIGQQVETLLYGKRILFLGDSVTAQLPWAFACALAAIHPNIHVKHVATSKREFDSTMQGDREVARSFQNGKPLINVYQRAWHIPALNLTLAYVKFDQYKPRQDANCTALCFECDNGETFCREAHGLGSKRCYISKKNQRSPRLKTITCNSRPVLTFAILKLIFRVNPAYDLIFASFGYHYHFTQATEYARDLFSFHTALLRFSKRTGSRAVWHEQFPQHFQSETGDYWQGRGRNGTCVATTAEDYKKYGGDWKNKAAREVNLLPILPTVSATLQWARLKNGHGDCTHWKKSPEIALIFTKWLTDSLDSATEESTEKYNLEVRRKVLEALTLETGHRSQCHKH